MAFFNMKKTIENIITKNEIKFWISIGVVAASIFSGFYNLKIEIVEMNKDVQSLIERVEGNADHESRIVRLETKVEQ